MVQLLKKNMRNIAVICSMAVLMLIGSAMAYFTSLDETSNRLTAWWHFDIALTEQNWNPESGSDVLPGDVLAKDPRIINYGVTAYVFLRVTVPCASPAVEFETGAQQGEIQQTAGTEIPLYKFVVNNTYDTNFSDAQKIHTECWKLVNSSPVKKDNCYVYVYAYTDAYENLQPLKKEETTKYPLFDAVKLCNFNETYAEIETEKSILVEAFGIQSDNLEIDSQTPENVWSLLENGG